VTCSGAFVRGGNVPPRQDPQLLKWQSNCFHSTPSASAGLFPRGPARPRASAHARQTDRSANELQGKMIMTRFDESPKLSAAPGSVLALLQDLHELASILAPLG